MRIVELKPTSSGILPNNRHHLASLCDMPAGLKTLIAVYTDFISVNEKCRKMTLQDPARRSALSALSVTHMSSSKFLCGRQLTGVCGVESLHDSVDCFDWLDVFVLGIGNCVKPLSS